ncbi:MAG: helix-turn-helix domain-containing protein [Sandaracinaceae bacterium]|nr:helix-turn-helix domain-containing protein [Sandaracinaceae bacterium]
MRLAARLIRAWSARALAPAQILHLASDGALARVEGGVAIDLRARRLLARLLARLAEPVLARASSRAVSVDALLEAGWPGERTVGASGQRRLQVAISRLRELGLRDVVETADGGYAIAAGWEVRAADATAR